MVRVLSSKSLSGLFLGVVAGVILAIFSAFPQIKLAYNAEGKWQGHYAYNDIDEVAYAAYVKALIDGRPRKNDPYSGRDQSPGSNQEESLFSIQFAAPYSVALPARVLGLSAPTAMTLSGLVAAFAAAFLLFLLISRITGCDWAGLAGALIVLSGGALAAGEGAIGEILGTGFAYPYFPFLRRYLPALPFAAFAGLLLCVWVWLDAESCKRRIALCVGASFLFSYLVFSYFYIWTAAAAWLALVAIGLMLFRPRGWKADIKGLIAFGIACLVPLAFYAILLSQRSRTLDQVQLLVNTHEPDLFRFPVYVATVALIVLIAGRLTGRIDFRERPSVFTLAMAVTPFFLFNQQILTGQSLQPIHYQVFIGNYIAGLALVLSAGLYFREALFSRSRTSLGACASLATLAVCWGFVECHYTVRVLDEANLLRDRQLPAELFLVNEAKSKADPFKGTVFAVSNILADDLPTVAPQNVLWARHQHIFPGLTWEESKERYYKYLYFQGLNDEWLGKRLNNGDFVSMIALFGWGRHSDRLTVDAAPLSKDEIAAEVLNFRKYIEEFDADRAAEPLLTHLVVPAGWDVNLENLKRWYEIGPAMEAGNQIVYRLTPK